MLVNCVCLSASVNSDVFFIKNRHVIILANFVCQFTGTTFMYMYDYTRICYHVLCVIYLFLNYRKYLKPKQTV